MLLPNSNFDNLGKFCTWLGIVLMLIAGYIFWEALKSRDNILQDSSELQEQILRAKTQSKKIQTDFDKQSNEVNFLKQRNLGDPGTGKLPEIKNKFILENKYDSFFVKYGVEKFLETTESKIFDLSILEDSLLSANTYTEILLAREKNVDIRLETAKYLAFTFALMLVLGIALLFYGLKIWNKNYESRNRLIIDLEIETKELNIIKLRKELSDMADIY